MTTAERTRCIHCNSPYIFHPSFYGGDEINYPYNHEKYCPDCYKAVKTALDKIPLKYEKKFLTSDKYSKKEIVDHQKERCKSPNGIPLRRIFANLIDMSGANQHNIVSEFMPDGNWYKAEWWSNTPDIVEITKETWVKIDG